ncbi:hypothetical protein ACFY0G_02125 [Streptomyces sp. NPDC001552]|uniref:hypothetical protein n=1 Tax=Streptomyces sp. NPDC001552 TaxID=3364587 RepID=UPI0036AA36A0
MKLPTVLAGLWETQDDAEDTEAAPAATTVAGPAPAPVVGPPKPLNPPTAHVPTYNGRPIPPGPIGGARYPLPGQTVSLDPQNPTPAPAAANCQHPRGRAEQDPDTREVTALVCDLCGTRTPVPPPAPQTPAPAEPDWWTTKAPAGPQDPAEAEQEHVLDDGQDDDGEPRTVEVTKEDGGEDEDSKFRRWAKALYGRAADTVTTPVPVVREARMSLIDRIRGTRINRWGFLYNLAALAVGSYWGLTGWTYDQVEGTDLAADSWHDAEPIACYVLYGLALLLDSWTNRRILPVAFLGRIPTVSCLVGALLYGGTETVTALF